MNEELKKMLDSINAKKQEVKDLCKAGKIEDAATAKEELKKLLPWSEELPEYCRTKLKK